MGDGWGIEVRGLRLARWGSPLCTPGYQDPRLRRYTFGWDFPGSSFHFQSGSSNLRSTISHLPSPICHFVLAVEPQISIAERWSAAEPSD